MAGPDTSTGHEPASFDARQVLRTSEGKPTRLAVWIQTIADETDNVSEEKILALGEELLAPHLEFFQKLKQGVQSGAVEVSASKKQFSLEIQLEDFISVPYPRLRQMLGLPPDADVSTYVSGDTISTIQEIAQGLRGGFFGFSPLDKTSDPESVYDFATRIVATKIAYLELKQKYKGDDYTSFDGLLSEVLQGNTKSNRIQFLSRNAAIVSARDDERDKETIRSDTKQAAGKLGLKTSIEARLLGILDPSRQYIREDGTLIGQEGQRIRKAVDEIVHHYLGIGLERLPLGKPAVREELRKLIASGAVKEAFKTPAIPTETQAGGTQAEAVTAKDSSLIGRLSQQVESTTQQLREKDAALEGRIRDLQDELQRTQQERVQVREVTHQLDGHATLLAKADSAASTRTLLETEFDSVGGGTEILGLSDFAGQELLKLTPDAKAIKLLSDPDRAFDVLSEVYAIPSEKKPQVVALITGIAGLTRSAVQIPSPEIRALLKPHLDKQITAFRTLIGEDVWRNGRAKIDGLADQLGDAQEQQLNQDLQAAQALLARTSSTT